MNEEFVAGIAAKNEEENVAYIINNLRKVGINNIYIVDEKSKDKTEKIAMGMGVPVYQRKGKGFGAGVKEVLRIAKEKGYKYVGRIDCDGTYPAEDLKKMTKYMKDYDLVMGYRNYKNVTPSHRLPNRFFTLLTNILFLGNIKDLNCGIKIFNVDKFHNLVDTDGWDLEAQVSIKALKKRYKIKQVPINYKLRYGGHSKIKIKDGFIILFRIIKERFIR